ncbi:MAG: hypothetical protein ACOCT9_02375 [archaeon]
MAAETSLWLDIISSHSNILIATERKQYLKDRLSKTIEDTKKTFEITSKYNFDLNKHIHLGNKHDAHLNATGCGCEYCKRRHLYAKQKVELHRKVKGFERYLEYGFYKNTQDSKLIEEFNAEKEEKLRQIRESKEELKEVENNLRELGITTF